MIFRGTNTIDDHIIDKSISLQSITVILYATYYLLTSINDSRLVRGKFSEQIVSSKEVII